MKNLSLLAAVCCLLATGCASSGLLGSGCGECCEPCHVSRSISAPRPKICRDACLPCSGGLGLFDRNKGCEVQCGCEQDCCEGGCCGDCDGCRGENCDCDICRQGLFGKNRTGRKCMDRCDDRCRAGIGRIASGFCPNSAGYPASYNYNPGPQTGQVAYPYYTVRGPRDFLQANPTRIGPN